MRFMDTKHISPEILLLTQCAKVTHTNDDIISIEKLLIQTNHNIQSLIVLAYKHAVLPLLYKTLKMYFPKHPIIDILNPHYMNIVQINMLMSTELIKCVDLLHTEKIRLLCIKGPVLSKLIYGDISLRQYGDLDILIQKSHREKVISLLKKHDFNPEIMLKPNTQKVFFDAVNVLGFQSPKKNVLIEIHWELLAKNYAIHWEGSSLWEQTQTVFLDKHPIETLNHTNHFIYLCVHGSKHLFERLSWVCDIDHYIQTQNDLSWEEILALAKKLGILRILFLSLNLSQALLHTPLPTHIKKKIAYDTPTQKLTQQLITLQFSNDPNNTKNIHSFKLLLNMRENKKDKIRFAWRALFSTKFDDFKYVQLPNYLRFLYPLIRPFRLATKYIR